MRIQFSGLKLMAISALIWLTLSCGNNESRIVIVSTNDIHSSIDAFPSLATLVEELRSENPGRFLLVDAGDRWTGNPYVDRAPEKYKPIIDLMNELGYDLGTFGNHEWDDGMATLAERTRDTQYEIILANALMSEDEIQPINGSAFRNIDGLRIGFYALVTTAVNGHPDGFEENFGKTVFYDPLKIAEEYKTLASESDLLVAVTHVGFAEDSIIALNHPEIDLIIGGHSHTVISEGKKINNTIVTQTGRNLRYAGVTTITHRKGKVKSIENRLVMLDTIARSPKFLQMVDKYNSEPSLKVKAGTAKSELNKIGLLNMFSDALRLQTGVDISLYNVGGMRLDALQEGDISRGDIYAAEPFGNVPVIVEMNKKELAGMIMAKFNSQGKESHALDLYPSGMNYTIITDGEGNATDVFISVDRYKDESGIRKYKVAMSDYVYATYDFEGKGTGERKDKPISEVVLDHLQRYPVVTNNNDSRVRIE